MIVVGSRGKPRTSFDSPVPVDNIQISELEKTGRGVLDQQLMFKVPSYNSTQQPISDAAAHFSPADLRGLLPSRTLVLVNGKRKNASALVYSYVTPGRGEVGVDMKSVPSAALKRVEVLRDGAAAQYGSDAVAGVINLVLKKNQIRLLIPVLVSPLKGTANNINWKPVLVWIFLKKDMPILPLIISTKNARNGRELLPVQQMRKHIGV